MSPSGPQVGGLLYGVKPAILAVIFHALWGPAHKAVKNRWLAGLPVAVVALALSGVNELALLFGAGLAWGLAKRIFSKQDQGPGATASIFLPAFIFVAISGPLIPKLRRSPVPCWTPSTSLRWG